MYIEELEMYVGVLAPVFLCIMNLLREVNMMDEKRLDRMEDMLATLITMVGNLNQQFGNLNQQVGSLNEQVGILNEQVGNLNQQVDMLNQQQKTMNEGIQVVKADQSNIRSENEKQFTEVLKKLNEVQVDQDYIWKKTASNERELARLKSHLQL
jgi:chromosome segregation ATPase